MSAGAIVAASARRAERRLIESIRAAHGSLPGSKPVAVTQTPSWMERRVLRRLIAAGAIVETADGYTIDEAAYTSYRQGRARRTLIGITAVSILSGFIIWWSIQK